MKKTILPYFLILFLFPLQIAWGETVAYKDLVKRKGSNHEKIYYKKFTDIPYTGKTKGLVVTQLKNGKPYGSYLQYHENGQLMKKYFIKEFPYKYHGKYFEYYSNGKLRDICQYKNGLPYGKCVSYFKNGRIEEIQRFNEKGQLHGNRTIYFLNGKSKESIYRNGIKYFRYDDYYKN